MQRKSHIWEQLLTTVISILMLLVAGWLMYETFGLAEDFVAQGEISAGAGESYHSFITSLLQIFIGLLALASLIGTFHVQSQSQRLDESLRHGFEKLRRIAERHRKFALQEEERLLHLLPAPEAQDKEYKELLAEFLKGPPIKEPAPQPEKDQTSEPLRSFFGFLAAHDIARLDFENIVASIDTSYESVEKFRQVAKSLNLAFNFYLRLRRATGEGTFAAIRAEVDSVDAAERTLEYLQKTRLRLSKARSSTLASLCAFFLGAVTSALGSIGETGGFAHVVILFGGVAFGVGVLYLVKLLLLLPGARSEEAAE